MKKIAIDIDDTITNTSEILFKYLEKYGKVDLSDPINNKLDIMRGKITCPELLDFYHEYAEEIAKNVSLKEGVKAGLDFLKKNGFEIHILSSRISLVDVTTVDFFNINQLLYDFIKVNILDKKKYCEENKIDILIDDSLEMCSELIGTNTVPILYKSLVNENIKINNVIKLDSWKEIFNIAVIKNN